MAILGGVLILAGVGCYALEGLRIPRRPRGGTPIELACLVAVAIGVLLFVIGIWEGVLG